MSVLIPKAPDDAPKQCVPSEAPAFRLVTTFGARVRPGVDLDRSRSADTDDDEALFGLRR